MTLGIAGALAIGQYAAAAVIVFFMRLADFIEGFTTDRARRAIQELLRLTPETARMERDGTEREIAADDVRRDEIVLVKPGGRIPVDGVVVDGYATVNQAPITGESVPVEKTPGSAVFAATVCERGALGIRVDRVGADTTFGTILRLVEQAEAAKARCNGSRTGSRRTTSRSCLPLPSGPTRSVEMRRRPSPPCWWRAPARSRWPRR
jgi:Cd2+/Zn2+-exporting ATPase/Cu+-exporting ATPase